MSYVTNVSANSVASMAAGGNYCSACFENFKHGSLTNLGTVTCGAGPDGVTPAPYCSGRTRVDTSTGLYPNNPSSFGELCYRSCTALTNEYGTGQCEDGANAYCEAHGTNPDCACRTPESQPNTAWGTGVESMTWTQLNNYVATNQQIESYNPKCFWPPCFAGTAGGAPPRSSVLAPKQDLSSVNVCPSMASLKCLIDNATINLKDVSASKINILTQKCGTTQPTTSTTVPSSFDKWWNGVSDALRIGFILMFVTIVVGSIVAVFLGLRYVSRPRLVRTITKHVPLKHVPLKHVPLKHGPVQGPVQHGPVQGPVQHGPVVAHTTV